MKCALPNCALRSTRVIKMLSGLTIGQSGYARFLGKNRTFESSRKPSVASACDCPNRLSGWLSRVVLGVLFCVLIRPAPAVQPVAKNVLVLHNWSSLPQTWNLMESTVRGRVPGQINFYAASIENPRFDEEVYRESMAETLRRGYGDQAGCCGRGYLSGASVREAIPRQDVSSGADRLYRCYLPGRRDDVV